VKLREWVKDVALAIAIAVVLVIFTGCAHNEPLVRVEKVPPPPVIVVPSRPDLVGQPPAEQVRGLYDYVLLLEAKLAEALNALKVYERVPAE
jgi:hypothetical protein